MPESVTRVPHFGVPIPEGNPYSAATILFGVEKARRGRDGAAAKELLGYLTRDYRRM